MDWLDKSTFMVIINASAGRQRGLNFTDGANSSVEIELVSLAKKTTGAFLLWRRAEVGELKHAVTKNVPEWHARSDQGS